ncbi:unnamed protein product [Protopolystoma xenopodis]|uniref:Ryanodine receptor Ryr domain-containing protein n=1 Tax=Protopolystoma xenopodis TaxID=117903 RepID=A0A3S5BYL7_9PLAT|nr:unnamed protein product [Protopolystoma xenopodis]
MNAQCRRSTKGGGIHQLMVPYDILTDRERQRYRKLTYQLIRFLQFNGYRLTRLATAAPATGRKPSIQLAAAAPSSTGITNSGGGGPSSRLCKQTHSCLLLDHSRRISHRIS